MFDIISYDDLIQLSKEVNVAERQPGVANYEDKLNLEKWIGNSYINLVRWIKDNHFLQGLVINQHCKMAISEKIAINFIKAPNVKSSDKSYLEINNHASHSNTNHTEAYC